jgi:endonuclease/exonuclease/phosphatase family metal-dependent hydrolase
VVSVQLRLATWNLHRCIGRDGVMSPRRCAAVLREIDADVIALQEVESHPGHALDTLAYLARATGSQPIAGTTMVREDAHYGNALLTRLVPEAVRHHDLSVPGREPRAALDVDLNLNGRQLQLIATHLGLRPAERRDQVRRLLPRFDVTDRDLVVLAGDLNEWFLWGRPLRMLHRLFPDTPHRRCWPAWAPLFALDRIWVRPRRALCRLATHRSALARVASDHLPLIADIKFHGAPGAGLEFQPGNAASAPRNRTASDPSGHSGVPTGHS